MNSSCRKSERFCADGGVRTGGAMNPGMLLRSSCASLEKGTELSLNGGCRFMQQVWGYHANKSHFQSCWGTSTVLVVLFPSFGHLLAVREVNNRVEEGPSYRDNFRQAVLSPFLPSRVGGRQAPCLSFFQAHQLHRQGGRGEGQTFCNQRAL